MERIVLKKYLKIENLFTPFSENLINGEKISITYPSNFKNKNNNNEDLFFFWKEKNPVEFKHNNEIENILMHKKNFFSKKLKFWQYNKNVVLNSFIERRKEISIKKIKFKPGYQTMWRKSRKILQLVLKMKFHYQYRLTRYLFKFKKFTKFKNHFFIETRLNTTILNTKILPDIETINNYIYQSFVFLNGHVSLNPYFQIIKNDLIQFVVSISYYIMYRTLVNLNLIKKISIRKKIKKKLYSFSLADYKQKNFDLPIWLSNYKNVYEDAGRYMEIDYFTLSAFIVYDLMLWNDLNPFNNYELRLSVINMYNWKYIN
uniref:Ribosomal protein S4 n=1 Tax=Paraurostyla sp. TaxID=6014 RepID=A0A3Q8C2F7_9STIC|nr:ribosomal protein S4 [Paraurostyla sp.]